MEYTGFKRRAAQKLTRFFSFQKPCCPCWATLCCCGLSAPRDDSPHTDNQSQKTFCRADPGKNTSVAIFTKRNGMGVGAIATYLIADEAEHYRSGIGCILEANRESGQVHLVGLIKEGTAHKSQELDEGDEILQIDDKNVHGMSVGEVSGLIRGKEGSLVFIMVRKADGKVRKVRLVRQRQPGSKTELLGALWQSHSNSSKSAKQVTAESKLDVLKQLRSRGNLTEEEYKTAVQRLLGDRPQLESSLSSGSGDHWFDSGRRMP